MKKKHSKAIGITLDENPDLKLSLEDTGFDGVMIIRLFGLIDTYNSDFFRKQAFRVVEAGYPNIIIDATSTTFISPNGIGSFMALLKNIRQKHGSMAIYGMPPKIYQVFQLLGFTSFFQFCATRDEALEKVNVDSSSAEVFPFQIVCPACNHKMKAVRSGRFRCISCRKSLVVGNEGKVHSA